MGLSNIISEVARRFLLLQLRPFTATELALSVNCRGCGPFVHGMALSQLVDGGTRRLCQIC